MTFAEYEPQLAKKSDEATALKPGRVAEPKLDGWRLIAHVDDDGVHLYSRTGKRYDGRLPHVERELARFPAGTVIDGEALAAEVDGDRVVHRWGAAQSILGSYSHPDAERITFVVFDLLAHGGLDARPLPLRKRRELLEGIFASNDFEAMQLIEQHPASAEVYQAFLARGFEGAVVKDPEARYASGARGAGWLKLKPEHTVDAFVLGFQEGKDSLTGRLGALVLHQVDEDGSPVLLGKCGSGISDELRDRIDADREGWIGRVVEVVRLGHEGDNWRPLSFRRERLDKVPEQCMRSEEE